MRLYDFFNILCSIPKTLRFNFHYFPFRTALRLPVFVSRKTYLRELRGEVHLPGEISTAMVKIGFGDVGHYDSRRSRSIWQVSGKVVFEGNAGIGHGSKLSVRGELRIGRSFNMTAESTIVCAEKTVFGDDCLLSWGIVVMDTDEHPIYNQDGSRVNPNRPVIVGNHVWIGCNCTILKGSELPDGTIVAAGAVTSSRYTEKDTVIGGNPAAVIRNGMYWQH